MLKQFSGKTLHLYDTEILRPRCSFCIFKDIESKFGFIIKDSDYKTVSIVWGFLQFTTYKCNLGKWHLQHTACSHLGFAQALGSKNLSKELEKQPS